MIELMGTCLIMTFVGAATASLIMLTGLVSNRLNNKVANLNSALIAMTRISRDVRMARNFGDIYGSLVTDNAQNPPQEMFSGSATFPSASNPNYSSGATPPKPFAGWPGAPWRTSNSYSCNGQCLVVQIPTFSNTGFPYGVLLPNPKAPPANLTQDDVNTLIYYVVEDPNSTTSNPTFDLQVAGFPGAYTSTPPLTVVSNPPQTILKGIVGPTTSGPVSSTNPPQVFSYIDSSTHKATTTPSDTDILNVTGVQIQFQVLNDSTTGIDSTTGKGISNSGPSIVGLKTEVYARNNTIQTVTATQDDLPH